MEEIFDGTAGVPWPDLHLLVCCQSRNNGLPCCAQSNSEELMGQLRSFIRQHRLQGRIWLTKTNCLGWCHADGATLVCYPSGRWWRKVRLENLRAIQNILLQELGNASF